jgi:cytochrome c oxidase subunit 3
MSSGSAENTAMTHEEHDHYDPEGAKIGMWLFLFTELLLFGALFIIFSVYLHKYHFDFKEASHHLNKLLGMTNTSILLTSSLTMVLSIAALERNKKGMSLAMMGLTLLGALVFLVIKYFEWGAKFAHDLYPKSETMLQMPKGEQLYFGLYFSMTGLHGLHIVIGASIILWAFARVWKGSVNKDRIVFLENVGLYWHLVDVIWIFLFPLFYLIG